MNFLLRIKLVILTVFAVFTPLIILNLMNLNSPFYYLAGAASSIFASLILLLILKPLDQFIKGANILSQGNLGYQLNLKTGDELQSVADAFNLMAGKLALSFQKME